MPYRVRVNGPRPPDACPRLAAPGRVWPRLAMRARAQSAATRTTVPSVRATSSAKVRGTTVCGVPAAAQSVA